MKSFASKLVPLAVASIVFGIALAGGDKGDPVKLMDADSDGKITATEHEAGARKMFTRMDADGNGRVTAAEMDASHATKANKGQKGGKMSSSAKIAAIDSDGDGELTAVEHATGSKQMFAKMDGNSDGTLTAQELKEGHRSMLQASEQ